MDIDYERELAEFEWDVPEEYNLPAVIESHAGSFGDRVALTFRDESGNRAERTFADLRDDMNRFANALADLGVGKGDRVMHLFPRHPDAFAIQLGILKRGALVVSCSSMLRAKDIAFRAEDCAATTVVCHESLTDMVEPVVEETPLETPIVLDGGKEGWHSFADLLDGRDDTHDGPDLAAEDPMTINYTSGTTGRPKPVMHRHRWMRCFELINGRYWWGYDRETDFSDELMWATTGTGWAKWFWSPVGVGLTTGAPQFVYDGEFDPETFL
jgi:acetyl-CoA synthetase